MLFKNLNEIKKHAKPVDFWTVNFCYFFSIRFVSLIQDTSISPDMITWISLVVSFIGSVLLFSFPQQYLFWVIAAILFQLAYILDCADGQLARYKKQFSLNGWRIDIYTDRIKEYLIMMSMIYSLSFVYRWIWSVGFIAIIIQSFLKYLKLQEILRATDFKFNSTSIDFNEEKITKNRKTIDKITNFKKKYKLAFMDIGDFYLFNFFFMLLGKMEYFFFVIIVYGILVILYKLVLHINNEKFLRLNIDRFLAEKKDIIVFGTGAGGKKFIANLLIQNINIRYLSDNDNKKWGTTILGLEIKSPEQIKVDKENINVLIASAWGHEIREQLLSYGLNEKQVVSLYD